MLAGSTAALVAAARDEAGAAGLKSHLLVYLPTVLDPAAPAVRRANVPLGWAAPAFDVLQLEDYDWVTEGRGAETASARAAMVLRLGYPAHEQHYFSGFVLAAADRAQWAAIAKAADGARRAGVARAFMWALPQVARDGFVTFDGEDDVQAFDAVDFPIAIGREAMALTEFSTQIVSAPSGHEQRASEWAEARMRYDAGPGVRSEADVRALAAFFRARRGAARAFRFRDPFDDRSAADGGLPTAVDQMLGVGGPVARCAGAAGRGRRGAIDERTRWVEADAPDIGGRAAGARRFSRARAERCAGRPDRASPCAAVIAARNDKAAAL